MFKIKSDHTNNYLLPYSEKVKKIQRLNVLHLVLISMTSLSLTSNRRDVQDVMQDTKNRILIDTFSYSIAYGLDLVGKKTQPTDAEKLTDGRTLQANDGRERSATIPSILLHKSE